MDTLSSYFKSSVGKKQIVAVTGLLLVGFLIGHLAGNLLVFLGPKAFNAYAAKMASLRPGLYIVEALLLYIFVVHMWTTASLVLDNIKARSTGYAKFKARGARSLATRLMPYTGTILLAFVVWHLMDFTFIDHEGSRSILSDGKSYGLYGVVYNSFMNPLHSGLYVIAMMALGFHLWHGIESFFQTFGFTTPKYEKVIKTASVGLGLLIAVGFSLIPICIFYSQHIGK